MRFHNERQLMKKTALTLILAILSSAALANGWDGFTWEPPKSAADPFWLYLRAWLGL
jgi:hypothetical protein